MKVPLKNFGINLLCRWGKIKYYGMAPCFIVKYPQAEGLLRWVQRLVYGNLITVKKLEAWFSVFQPPPICGSGGMADTVVSKTTATRFKGSNPFSRITIRLLHIMALSFSLVRISHCHCEDTGSNPVKAATKFKIRR